MKDLKFEKPVMDFNDIVGVRRGNLKIVFKILFCITFILFKCVVAAEDHNGQPYDNIGRRTAVNISTLFAVDSFDLAAIIGNSALKHLLVFSMA